MNHRRQSQQQYRSLTTCGFVAPIILDWRPPPTGVLFIVLARALLCRRRAAYRSHVAAATSAQPMLLRPSCRSSHSLILPILPPSLNTPFIMSSSRPPFMRALDQVRRQLEQQVRAQQAGGGGRPGGSSGGGGGGPSMGALAGGGGALFLLAGGGILLSQSLFNVDGGHRAIKYSRFSGIQPDIYPEGTHLMVSRAERLFNALDVC